MDIQELISKCAAMVFNDIDYELEGWRYYSQKEINENRDIFVDCVINKDYEYINRLFEHLDNNDEYHIGLINETYNLMNGIII